MCILPDAWLFGALLGCVALRRPSAGMRTTLLFAAFPPHGESVRYSDSVARSHRPERLRSWTSSREAPPDLPASSGQRPPAHEISQLNPLGRSACRLKRGSRLPASSAHRFRPGASVASLSRGHLLREQAQRTGRREGFPLSGDVSLLHGELAQPTNPVARISRSIGNFDTTAKAHRWQEPALAALGDSGFVPGKPTHAPA